MKQVGVILNSLIPSEINLHVQKQIHEAIKQQKITDGILFYINKSIMMNIPELAVYHVSDMACFPGDVVATCLDGLSKLIKFPIQGRKFFYIHSPEWIIRPPFSAVDMNKMYNQRDVTYVACSTMYRDMVQNNFNNRVSVAEDFCLREFL